MSSVAGKLSGFEALMRWTHPVHGQVPPSEFIALAEETGTILALGEWGLRTACRFAASWKDRSLSIAVNVSTVQIRHSDLVHVVKRALSDYGLEASRLELEITETAFLATTNEAKEVLESLRKLGVRLALDDFGTGYSRFELPPQASGRQKSRLIEVSSWTCRALQVTSASSKRS